MKPSYGYINIFKAFGALRNSFFNNSKHGGYLLREKELTLCDFTWRVTCESELNLSRCLYLTPVFGLSPSCISDLFVDSDRDNDFFVDDKFWSALVDIQVGAAEAERFSKAFHEVHRKLVYEELSLDAACRFISSSKISRQ
ncbi:hypothetical protein NC652_023250 [Populus alba x Populus x berolinensis]|nr:hypothetical protein NC652_023250 [Populus alba x Populus x berolinensis]